MPGYRIGSRFASGMSNLSIAILCLFAAALIRSPERLDGRHNLIISGIRAPAVHYLSLAVLTDQPSSHRNTVYSRPAADDATVRPLRSLFQRNQSLSSWTAGNAGQYHAYGSRPDTVTGGLRNRLLQPACRGAGCCGERTASQASATAGPPFLPLRPADSLAGRCDGRAAAPAHDCATSSLASEILMSANTQ